MPGDAGDVLYINAIPREKSQLNERDLTVSVSLYKSSQESLGWLRYLGHLEFRTIDSSNTIAIFKNSNGADQPVQMHRLTCTFAIHTVAASSAEWHAGCGCGEAAPNGAPAKWCRVTGGTGAAR